MRRPPPDVRRRKRRRASSDPPRRPKASSLTAKRPRDEHPQTEVPASRQRAWLPSAVRSLGRGECRCDGSDLRSGRGGIRAHLSGRRADDRVRRFGAGAGAAGALPQLWRTSPYVQLQPRLIAAEPAAPPAAQKRSPGRRPVRGSCMDRAGAELSPRRCVRRTWRARRSRAGCTRRWRATRRGTTA